MENITKADSIVITDNWDDLTERTDCLERQLSKVKILSRPTELKGKVNMEQQSQRVILTDPEEQQRTQYVPDAKVLIMKRPVQSMHISGQTTKPKQPIKTLEQRQAEYNQARIRILGNAEPLSNIEKNGTITDAILIDKSGDAVQGVQQGTASRQPQQPQQKQKQQKQSQHKQQKPIVSNNRHNKAKATEQQQPLQPQQQGPLAPSQPPVTPQNSGPYLPLLPSHGSHYVTECHQGVQQQYLTQQQQLYDMQQQQYNSRQQQFNQQYNPQQQQQYGTNQDSASAPPQFVMPLPQYGVQQQFTIQRPPPSFPACLPVTRFMPAFLPQSSAPQYSQPQGYPSHMPYPPPLSYPPQPQLDNKRNPLLMFEQLGAEHYRRTETQLPQCNAVIPLPDGSRGTFVNGEGVVGDLNTPPCGSMSLQTASGGKPHATASCSPATFSGDNNGNGSTNSFGSCLFFDADVSGNSLSSKSKDLITASSKKTSPASASSSARKSNRKNRKSLPANNSSSSSVTGLSIITNGSSSGDAANTRDVHITTAANTSSNSNYSANICISTVNSTEISNNSTESSVPFTNTKRKKRGKKKNVALASLACSDPSTRTVIVSNSKDVNSRILRLPKGPDGTNGFHFIRQL